MTDEAETQALAVLAQRIREQFPGLPPEDVEAAIAGFHREYDGRPVREFVPLLVERQVREHLSGSIPAQRRSAPDVRDAGSDDSEDAD